MAGSILGLLFAAYSTSDYAAHLDRGIHDLHCSVIPGMPPSSDAEACRAAMYSPYSAIARGAIWGGVPISLFALGAFSFFATYAAFLLIRGASSGRTARLTFGVLGVTPLLVSLCMLVLAITRVGALCKTCVGIYISSSLLAIGAVWIATTGLRLTARGSDRLFALAATLAAALGLATALPAVTYAATAPDHSAHLEKCGSIKLAPEAKHELLELKGSDARREAMFFEDPLCPTCKAFHARLLGEDVIDKLNTRLVLFPLDSECNWMLGEPLHPGACLLSRAILCAEDPRKALEWSFDNQEDLARAGKAGPTQLGQRISAGLGDKVAACMNSTKTKQRLNKHLHYAAENNVPLSTPQMYLGQSRICDEDTDIGLRFTLRHLAPELVQ
ncbi:MAG TPA: vitamin K epoxide reductase family protein [Polyangiaceae bacterium]|nr:vitamin K epoxide reductase family protein [Polyangiaceae bacterium]